MRKEGERREKGEGGDTEGEEKQRKPRQKAKEKEKGRGKKLVVFSCLLTLSWSFITKSFLSLLAHLRC